MPIINLNNQQVTDTVGHAALMEAIHQASHAASMESFESMVASFSRACDVFLGFLGTFKTNITKFMDPIKRAELQKYCDDHPLMVRQVEAQPYERWKRCNVNNPTGMHGTFMSAFNTVRDIYTTLAIKEFIESFEQKLDDVEVRMSVSKDLDPKALTDYTPMLSAQAKALEPKIKKLYSTFTEQRTPEMVRFSTCYESIETFKSVRTELLDAKPWLVTAMNLSEVVDKLDTRVSRIVAYVSDGQHASKDTIESFGACLNHIATGLDLYGVCVARQLTLEHNHCRNLNILAELL